MNWSAVFFFHHVDLFEQHLFLVFVAEQMENNQKTVKEAVKL